MRFARWRSVRFADWGLNMSTTPAMYYWYFVVPNLDDLRQSPRDVRRAFNAAVSAFHLSDVFLEYYTKRDPSRLPTTNREDFLKFLEGRERAFVTVQTAATVYKHLYTSSGFLDGNSPQSFAGITTGDVTIEGVWRDSGTDAVTIKRKDNIEVSLNDALEAVVYQLWPSILGPDLD